MKESIKISLIFVLFALFSCQSYEKSTRDYLAWMKDNELFIKQKKVGDLTISLSYEPNMYRAYKFREDYEDLPLDSIASLMRNNLVFKLMIQSETLPITTYGIHSQEEYQTRMHQLSFGMKELIYSMDEDAKKILPQGVEFENRTQFDGSLVFTLVFSREQGLGEELQVLFSDGIWDTGLHKFKYNIREIDRYRIKE
jgi:hypothetical protein